MDAVTAADCVVVLFAGSEPCVEPLASAGLAVTEQSTTANTHLATALNTKRAMCMREIIVSDKWPDWRATRIPQGAIR